MSITTALHWRYATKRMNGTRVPKMKMDIILDAISLAPSSFGLQPYSVIIIENIDLLTKIKPIAMMQPQITDASSLLVFAAWKKITSEKIDSYMNLIAEERDVAVESLSEFKAQVASVLKNSESDNFIWSSKQAYIALGVGLVAAAEVEIDSTPMEGFDKKLLDELLQLEELGLSSLVLMTLGFRDAKNDFLVNLKKVRRDKEQLFIRM